MILARLKCVTTVSQPCSTILADAMLAMLVTDWLVGPAIKV